MKVTIYDIAQKAGVSIATVSKVINKTGKIGQETRNRVLRIMEEMDYRPSVVASALTNKRTFTIGLLIPDIANPFFAEIARSIEDRGHDLDYSVVICSTDHDADKEKKYMSLLEQKGVDGIIIATGARNHEVLKGFIEHGTPLAIIARDMPSLPVDSVLVDDFMGGYLATKHLLELEHRHIAIVSENLEVMSSKERIRGYRQALEEHHIAFDSSMVYESDFTIEGGKKLTQKMLASNTPPTAIFAGNDMLAIGVIQGARSNGLRIPDDLSVVGFDNTVLATITDPPLTTIAQPIHDIGEKVLDLLVDDIEGKKKQKQRVILLPELIIRGSTKMRND